MLEYYYVCVVPVHVHLYSLIVKFVYWAFSPMLCHHCRNESPNTSGNDNTSRTTT